MNPIGPFLVAMLVLLVAVMPAEAAQKKKKKEAPASAPAPTQPATPKAGAAQPLGQSGSWTAYQAQDGTGLVCYITAAPQKSEPAASRKAMAMVTHRPGEKISNVVSFVEGYPLKPGSEVQIDIGGSKFDLFTKDDSAWARTAELDRMIVTSLGKAKQVTVRGTPQKGAATTDTYALVGFGKALALIDKACGLKR